MFIVIVITTPIAVENGQSKNIQTNNKLQSSPKTSAEEIAVYPQDKEKNKSQDLFENDSEDDFNFPLSQVPGKGNDQPRIQTQVSRSSSVGSSTFKLLEVTPHIIESPSIEDNSQEFIDFAVSENEISLLIVEISR